MDMESLELALLDTHTPYLYVVTGHEMYSGRRRFRVIRLLGKPWFWSLSDTYQTATYWDGRMQLQVPIKDVHPDFRVITRERRHD